MFVLPTIVTCLAFGSTSCYGNSGGRNTQNTETPGSETPGKESNTSPNPNRSVNPTVSQVAYTGTDNSTGASYINKYSNGSSNVNNAPNPKDSTLVPYTNGGNSCSTMDLSVFEEADEENVYNNFGFTRGDIKNLYIYKYDPKSEQTVCGTIAKILRVQFPDNNCYLVAVMNTTQGNVLANLGPVWFIDENNLVVNEGDQIDVTGSVVRTNGRYIVIASQFKKNGHSLTLRNQSGNPQWGSPKSQKGTTGTTTP